MALMTRKEAMAYLHVSNGKMYELTTNGELAYHQSRGGGAMLFLQQDLDAYIASIRVPTAAERAAAAVLPGGSTYRRRRITG